MIAQVVDSSLPNQVTVERLVATALFSDRGKFWGGNFGSRLHELEREPITEATAAVARAMVIEALQPLVAAKVIAVQDIVAETSGGMLSIAITVKVAGDEITMNFADLWGLYGA